MWLGQQSVQNFAVTCENISGTHLPMCNILVSLLGFYVLSNFSIYCSSVEIELCGLNLLVVLISNWLCYYRLEFQLYSIGKGENKIG